VVRDAGRLLQVMRGENEGDLPPDREERFLESSRRPRVEQGARLIQKQDAGPSGEGARQAETLREAGAE
jgi:hypothetical protein